jgi:hypothetical protein
VIAILSHPLIDNPETRRITLDGAYVNTSI